MVEMFLPPEPIPFAPRHAQCPLRRTGGTLAAKSKAETYGPHVVKWENMSALGLDLELPRLPF